MLSAFGDLGIDQITNLFYQTTAENKVPVHWNSVIENYFKNKTEAIGRGNYGWLKLL